MHLINSKKIENSKAINVFSNLSDYFIQIDYYDNKGIKKIKKACFAHLKKKKTKKI